MKRYNRWFNLITSIVVDVLASLFFIFAAMPCYTDRRWYGYDYVTHRDSYYYYTYNLYDGYNYYAIFGLIFMYVFIVFSTASVIIDILHAAGPFKESKAYRILHLLFSATCFVFSTTAIVFIAISLGCSHSYIYAAASLAFSCLTILCAIEVARSIMGIIACKKASSQKLVNGTSIPKDVRYNSDYAVKKLKDLKDLLSEGIISEEEYNEAKKKYVKDL